MFDIFNNNLILVFSRGTLIVKICLVRKFKGECYRNWFNIHFQFYFLWLDISIVRAHAWSMIRSWITLIFWRVLANLKCALNLFLSIRRPELDSKSFTDFWRKCWLFQRMTICRDKMGSILHIFWRIAKRNSFWKFDDSKNPEKRDSSTIDIYLYI